MADDNEEDLQLDPKARAVLDAEMKKLEEQSRKNLNGALTKYKTETAKEFEARKEARAKEREAEYAALAETIIAKVKDMLPKEQPKGKGKDAKEQDPAELEELLQKSPAYAKLQADLAAAEKKREATERRLAEVAKQQEQTAQEKAALAAQAKEEALRQKALKALTKGGVKDPEQAEDALDLLLARKLIRYGEDDQADKVIFKSGDDLPVELEKGIAAWLKEPRQKKFLPAVAPNGSGGGPGGGGNSNGHSRKTTAGAKASFNDLLSEALAGEQNQGS